MSKTDLNRLQTALQFIPLIRGKHPTMELAIFNPLNPTVLYIGDWRLGRTIFNTKDIGEWETMGYDSIKEILIDGWRVD